MRTVLALLALEASTAAAQRVIEWKIGRNAAPVSIPRRVRKRDTVNMAITNAETLYYANVTVGTPGQEIGLQLDTGSSDVWVVSSNADCFDHGENICTAGTFDQTQSSTFTLTQRGGFNITYVDGTGSTGNEFTDVITVGGQKVTDLTMGLALETTIGVGIIGVSFPQDESKCTSEDCSPYPTIVDQMVTQGLIGGHAYSLWLDDLSASTGSILFGGVDTSKYSGDLIAMPIIPTAPDLYTAFSVAWTNLQLTTPKSTSEVMGGPLNYVAILDSGTSLIAVPDSMLAKLKNLFGAQYSSQLETYVVPCSIASSDSTLDFQFAGASGPTIKVPVSEFVLDLGTDQNGQPFTFANGDKACEFGVQGGGGEDETPILLGDTFLRSAYVVYDMDNKLVAMAQANFNGGSSNIKEINLSSAIPEVSKTATAYTVASTPQFSPGGLGTPISTPVGSPGVTPTLSGSVAPLASFTTSSSAGSPARAPPTSAAFEKALFVGIASLLAVITSGVVLL